MKKLIKLVPSDHRLLIGFALMSTLLLCMAGIALLASERHRATGRWIAHTHEVEAEIAQARFSAIQFAEIQTGTKGKAAKNNAFAALEQRRETIRKLTSDNPVQQNALLKLEAQIKQVKQSAVPPNTLTEALDQMAQEEERLLKLRRARSDHEAGINDAAILVSSVIMLVLLGCGYREIRRAERRRREAHEKTTNVLESIQDGFFAVDKDWNITYINEEMKKTWGMPDAELIGFNLWELHPDARGTEFERQNTRALREQIVIEYSEYYPTHGIWYEVKVYPTPEGLSLYCRDVTAAHNDKAALERSEKALHDAQAMAHIGSWEADLLTGETFCTQELYRIYDLAIEATDAAEAKSHLIHRFFSLQEALQKIHPDDRARVAACVHTSREKGIPYEIQYRVLLPTGETRHIHSRCHVTMQDGVAARLAGTVQDITERKAAEERFETLFEHSSDAHLLFDDTGIIDCNHAAVAMLRCASKAEMLALHPAVLSPTYQADGRLSLEKCVEMDAIARERGHHRFEWTHRKMDGEVFPVEVSLTPVALKEKPALLVVWHDLTERKRAEEEVRQNRDKLAALIEAIPDILYRVDRHGVCVDFIAAEKEHNYYTAEECVGKNLFDVLPQEVARLTFEAVTLALETKTAQLIEYALKIKDELRFREARAVAQSGGDVLIIVRDITDRKRMEQRFEAVNRQNKLLLESIGEGVYGIDLQGKATFVNPTAATLLGYEAAEILGQNVHALIHHTKADGSPYPVAECPIYYAMKRGEVLRCSNEVFWRKEGSALAVEYVSTPILEAGVVVGMVVSFQDITERRQMEIQIDRQMAQMNEYSTELEFQKSELVSANQQLEWLATTDGLTGLKNHRNFQTHFADEFQRATRYGASLSVLLLDVDKFKQFNDTFGHPAGDQTLKTVARALTMAARSTDFVARYGGEEFAVILPETDAQGAIEAAERFRAAVEGQEWPSRAVTVSIGVATYSLKTQTTADLLQQADEALYASKHAGRNRATHFNLITPLDEAPQLNYELTRSDAKAPSVVG